MSATLPLPLLRKGKVREVYDLGDKLLMCASDRVSAFDFVLHDVIPDKGKILNTMSEFWFNKTRPIARNHMISCDMAEIGKYLPNTADRDYFNGRTMLVKKAERIDFECVVRGYLAGSGWKEYQKQGTVCGQKLPEGLAQAQKLPSPIFTPATKMDSGHDENVPFDYMARRLGKELADKLKQASVALYEFGQKHLEARGIILADTKFEFGILDGDMMVIDEVLTPDSSRFWDKDAYKTGTNPESFDKQIIRDYLENCGWDKQSTPPSLPPEIISRAADRYKEVMARVIK